MKYEEIRPFIEESIGEQKEFEKQQWKIRQEEMKKQGVILQDWSEPLSPEQERERMLKEIEKPGTMDNGTATVLWLVAMVVSLLFKGGWMMCVLLTIAWFKHITR